jgi:hypothetical protein
LIKKTIISKKIIKPEKCILGFGIPTSREEFEDKLDRTHYGFSHLFRKYYGDEALDQYNIQFLDNFRMIKPFLIDLGLRIFPNLGLKDFQELFHSERYDVIILFSHTEEKTREIEFYDGFANSTLILESIPETFSGIIDLSTCPLPALVKAIRNERVNCIIRSNKSFSQPKPFFWLHFYKVLFSYMKQSKKTYLQAFHDVVREFSKTKHEKKISS